MCGPSQSYILVSDVHRALRFARPRSVRSLSVVCEGKQYWTFHYVWSREGSGLKGPSFVWPCFRSTAMNVP